VTATAHRPRARRRSSSRRAALPAVLLCIVIAVPAPARADAPPAAQPLLAAAAIASPDRFGAAAAREILARGGNAVDAAVALAFALAVTRPEAGNLGGGGLMTLYVDGHPYFIDYRERAPARATRDMYLDATGAVVADASVVGCRSVAVPGTVAGLWEVHRRFGRLSWRRDLGPAIRMARDGFVVDAYLARMRDESLPDYAGKTNFARYFGGLKAGERLRQPELAATLARIAERGRDGFYAGATARRISSAMQRCGGLVTQADLAAYRVAWREPLVSDWQGLTVVTAPPPSSGGVGLVQLLLMKQALEPQFRGLPLNSAHYIHLLAEIEKRVFADRAAYLGDPDFIAVPVQRLVDPAYLAQRASEVDANAISATGSVRAGGAEQHDTTHFSIVDRRGNAVANTYTLNGSFGSGVVVERAGFLLNNEMDDFASQPGAPNMYGVVGGEANAIAPGKRPLSSMAPTILLKDGRAALVIGTPGGSRIFPWIFQVIVDVYDFHLPLAAAVAAARVHHQLLPENRIFLEPFARPEPAVIEALRALGYSFEDQSWYGDIAAIQIEGATPVAVSDPRGDGVGITVP
jgi:gamma-glutamyltranspeptidase/glutathione hydrolase